MTRRTSLPVENEAVLIAALNHSWAWVDSHSTRRAQTVNIYLVATAFLTTVWVTEINSHLKAVGAATSITSAFSSIAFWRADVRSRKYLTAGDSALRAAQGRIAGAIGLPELQISTQVKRMVPPALRMSTLLNIVYAVGIASSVAGACYAFIE